MIKNYYKILGLAVNCNGDEIKKAYRRLALLYHPDHNGSEEASRQFIDINEAYKVLSNETKRRNYDYLLKYGILLLYKSNQSKKYNGTAKSRHVARPVERKPAPERFRMESIMFFALLLLGIISILLSLFDLFSGKYEGTRSFTGISFGITFTGLLVYGWYEFLKTHD